MINYKKKKTTLITLKLIKNKIMYFLSVLSFNTPSFYVTQQRNLLYLI